MLKLICTYIYQLSEITTHIIILLNIITNNRTQAVMSVCCLSQTTLLYKYSYRQNGTQYISLCFLNDHSKFAGHNETLSLMSFFTLPA